ncbi:S8 family serine peptidase [Flavobacterium difficile]|uniref:S8 family serine peptidase n=1 Tax=Flavobacterium difficile TaxID=2709659 RepID=A0ABX0I308_9FLAO|nr:S8 family serine peptidase [Flavobacterium difficile]NHM00523.1 S8 family serine peptidase [Flavobacterium difficile]
MKHLLFFIIIFCTSCKTLEKNNYDNWYYLDFQKDKIPGISLNKWYAEIKDKKVKQKEIIVAVLDTQIDISHEDLKDQLWINKKEIPDNYIDDDKNGFIDDINGWNFLGTKSSNYIVWTNFEYIRFIRKWKSSFENKTESEIDSKNLKNFKIYNWSKKMQEYYLNFYKTKINTFSFISKMYPRAKDTLKHYFPNENYSIIQLDSMYERYKLNDKTFKQRMFDLDDDFGALIEYTSIAHSYNIKSVYEIKNKIIQFDSIINKNLNLDYNERVYIDENNQKFDNNYGTNKLNMNIKNIRSLNYHSTKVSGIIASNRNNKRGTKGFSNQIKIMPLVISASGDEHDKDIANAIYYAVDNGAKVINMSFGKEITLEKEWVNDAIKYAEKNNVLIIHAAGNEALNTDKFQDYPDDYDFEKKEEICNNFISVGSISEKTDSLFASTFSNYGKVNVDIFAPGENIYTCIPNNKYELDSGTSLAAPMVSGTAALIWLYYPKLTAKQVKDIILESSVKYDLDVIVPGTTDKKVKFSELSKSGGVLNAYNAMLLAEKVSKQNQNETKLN